jgi:hypothetical protein
MSPEQGSGRAVDARADVYSLGVVAYELLTGRVPYVADTPFAVVAAHMRDPLPLPSSLNSAISAGQERALLKALAKDPAQRFASAPELAEALRADTTEAIGATSARTIVPRAVATEARGFALPALRSRLALAIGAVALLVVAGTGVAVSGAFGGARASAPPGGVASAGEPGLPHGALLYELDRTLAGAGKVQVTLNKGDPPIKATFQGDALQLDTPFEGSLGVNTSVNLDDFVAQLRVIPLSGKGRITIGFRSRAQDHLQAWVFPTTGQVGLARFRTATSTLEDIVPAATRFPATPSGSEVEMVLTAHGGTVALFVGGNEVLRAADPDPRSGGIHVIVSAGTGSGESHSVKLTSFRVFADPTPAGAVVPSPSRSAAPSAGSGQTASPGLSASPGVAAVTTGATPSPNPLIQAPPNVIATPTPTPRIVNNPTPPPSPTPSQGPPKFAIPAKGPLVWQASLDGTPSDVRLPRWINGDNTSAPSDIRFVPGAIEVVVGTGVGTGLSYAAPRPLNYVMELELTAANLSAYSRFNVRSLPNGANGDCSFAVTYDRQFVTLQYYLAPNGPIDLTPQIPITGLRSGRVVVFAVVANGNQLTLFVDQKQVAQVTDVRCGAPLNAGPNMNADLSQSGGTLRIVGARIYDLPAP